MYRSRYHIFIFCACVVFVFSACAPEGQQMYDRIAELQEEGQFARAETLIKDLLKSNADLNPAEKRTLEFELERNRRVRNDYGLGEQELFDNLNRRLNDLTREEFDEWLEEKRFDELMIDGEKRFVNPSVSNLFFRFPELRKRQKNYSRESRQAKMALAQARELKSISKPGGDPVRLPRRCLVNQSIKLKEGFVPAGETVRCWLPYPVVCSTQGDVQLLTTQPEFIWITHPTSTIRSVYMEDVVPDMGRLQFRIAYYYTAYAYYQQVDPDKVSAFDKTEPEYIIYTKEEYPHEVFTPELVSLSAQITQGEANPYEKGKRIYEWIADNIKYSYAREYSTLRNISVYCLDNKFGDCGQEAILFITLCRIAGVPARWQSGFFMFPGDEGMHDWTEIYIKPYGWIPVDPYMGIFFTSMTEDLTAEEREEMRDFYYGNIDHYRLVVNKGHNQNLYPPKEHFRSETVDFQRGEIEWSQNNLYFTDWNWSIDVEDSGI